MKIPRLHLIQGIFATLLIIAALLMLYALHTSMGSAMHIALATSLAALFFWLMSLFWREQSGDERDLVNRAFASRIAFMVAMTMLLLGIIYQSAMQAMDPWLIGSFAVALSTKIIVRLILD